MKITDFLGGGHFTRIFKNFKDFPGELKSFRGLLRGEVKFQEFPGVR